MHHSPEAPTVSSYSGVGDGGLSITVAVALGGDGSAQSVTFESVSGSRPGLAELLFRQTVKGAMRESRFEAACGGKTVRFVFSFQINRDGPPDVYFLFPNRFEIEAEPPIVNVEK